MAARWLDQDAQELLRHADAMGVRVNRNSVEKVPPRKLSDYVLRALPGTPTGIGVQLNIQHQLGISFRQVQGAAIKLVKDQKARWRGPTLVGIPA